MRVGYFTMPLHPPGAIPAARWPTISSSSTLDQLGYEEAWIGEHITAEYLADNMWLIGDPDEVVRRIRALRDEVGDFGTLLVIGHEWEPREAWTRSMRLLVEEVLPRL